MPGELDVTIGEFLGRLERVRKTNEGWMAACPAHEDRVPSLSVGTGEDGRILLRCHAECELGAIVAALGLRVSDLFAEAPSASGLVRPAMEVPPAAEWLRKVRCLPDSEIARMWATETLGAPAVVFPYQDAAGTTVYHKLRSLSVKKFWRRPSGRESILYGLPSFSKRAGAERVFVVEGELDVHALRAVGIGPVVSVPDGSGSRLTAELLAPLAPFREVIIATDADAVGDALAVRLAKALIPERCRRARFVAGEGRKDANDALQAGWERADFERILAEAPSMGEADAVSGNGPGVDVSPAAEGAGEAGEENLESIARRYEVIDGCICYRRTDRKGNEVVECLANFDARVDEEVTFDDGAETRREFRISGRLASGESLTAARVNAAEFGGLTWITREWGIRAVVAAGNGTRDHLRTAIQHLSSPTRRRIYRHTGWIDREGQKAFLFQGGALGADGIEVDLPPPLDRFRLPGVAEGLREALSWSLRFLDCGPLEVTAPLLAAVYVAPVSTVLNPDVSVWLHGRSGSLKSTLIRPLPGALRGLRQEDSLRELVFHRQLARASAVHPGGRPERHRRLRPAAGPALTEGARPSCPADHPERGEPGQPRPPGRRPESSARPAAAGLSSLQRRGHASGALDPRPPLSRRGGASALEARGDLGVATEQPPAQARDGRVHILAQAPARGLAGGLPDGA